MGGKMYSGAFYCFIFLPVSIIIYALTPRRFRGKVLTLISLFYFFVLSRFLVLVPIITIFDTHFAAKLIEKKKKKVFFFVPFILLFGALACFKYFPLGLTAPIGISFYTMAAAGYLLDVYWKRTETNEKLEHTALFLTFFPVIVEGPILRQPEIRETLFKFENISLINIEKGAVRIAWGLFKKLVIADRLSVAVGTIFDNYQNYHGFMIVCGAIMYTFQLYLEFSGVMDIVVGSGWCFGIKLPENFRQPFFSEDASDFWKRWHISLGAWFREYIFYPISVSGVVKKWMVFGRKKFGRWFTNFVVSVLCLFPVWLCNGIWHGSGDNFIFYGMYYFVLILFETSTKQPWHKLMKKIHVNVKAPWYIAIRTVKVLALIFIGETIFRANNLSEGLSMIGSIFKGGFFDGVSAQAFLDLRIDAMDYLAIGVGLFVVFLIDLLKEKNRFDVEKLFTMKTPVKWAICYALIFSVIIFGAYGDGYGDVALIYAGF